MLEVKFLLLKLDTLVTIVISYFLSLINNDFILTGNFTVVCWEIQIAVIILSIFDFSGVFQHRNLGYDVGNLKIK